MSHKCGAQTAFPVSIRSEGINRPAENALLLSSVSSLIVSAGPGADISGIVSAALTTMGSTCGTVTIAPGSYTWGTPNVTMLPCETLQGVGATVLVKVEGNHPFLIVQGPAPPGIPRDNTYTIGSIRGVTFAASTVPSSQDSSTGIQLGGATSADPAQLFNLYDVHIRSFGCGINVEWAHQIAFFGGSIEGNYDGICFANIITGLENLNFHATQILNNLDYGINDDQTGVNVEISLTDCSLDYNGQLRTTGGQIQITNGKLNIINGHLENTGLPMITIPVPGAPAVVSVYIAGTAFNVVDTDTSRSYKSFISVRGLNDVLEIGRGVSFYSQGASVAAVAEWAPIFNGNSRLLMDPYTYLVSTTPQGLSAYVGTTPNNYSYATYDGQDNVTGMVTSFAHAQEQHGTIERDYLPKRPRLEH